MGFSLLVISFSSQTSQVFTSSLWLPPIRKKMSSFQHVLFIYSLEHGQIPNKEFIPKRGWIFLCLYPCQKFSSEESGAVVRHPLRHPYYSTVGLRCAGPVLLQGARPDLHVWGIVGGLCVDGQGTGPAFLRWVGLSLPWGAGPVLSSTLASEGSALLGTAMLTWLQASGGSPDHRQLHGLRW